MITRKLSKAGATRDGLACPKCGSTSFRAKRSAGGKLVLGVLAPKTRAQCVVCKKEFKRG